MARLEMKNAYTVKDGIATVELTQGRAMTIDVADLPRIAPHRWHALRSGNTFYAVANIRKSDGRMTSIRAHRLLCGLDFGDPQEVDHVNGDGFDNTPLNLLVTSRAGNAHNQHGKHRRNGRAASSEFPGVYWYRRTSRWRAHIWLDGRMISLGYWTAEADAADAYRRAKVVRDTGGTREEIGIAGRRIFLQRATARHGRRLDARKMDRNEGN